MRKITINNIEVVLRNLVNHKLYVTNKGENYLSIAYGFKDFSIIATIYLNEEELLFRLTKGVLSEGINYSEEVSEVQSITGIVYTLNCIYALKSKSLKEVIDYISDNGINIDLMKCINPIKDDRIVNDVTFATRLLKYLKNTLDYIRGIYPGILEEENEYLTNVANKLLRYQKNTATTELEKKYLEEVNNNNTNDKRRDTE